MERQQAQALFHSMHPGFFERDYIKTIPDDTVFDELILALDSFDGSIYTKEFGDDISFGMYSGDHNALLDIVAQVDKAWPGYFGKEDRVYCGYVNDKPVSFCIIEDMGTHEINGKMCRTGGPGCVGTLPEYRNRGIGLMMVNRATQILKDEGYSYSYIHYTHIPKWYAKLGYEPLIRWTKNGFVE